jgi:hypothetical protein
MNIVAQSLLIDSLVTKSASYFKDLILAFIDCILRMKIKKIASVSDINSKRFISRKEVFAAIAITTKI